MAQAQEQVVAGTAKEIAEYLQSAQLGNKQLTLIVPPDDESDLFPSPPNTVRDQAHLEALLLEAIASPKEEVTDQEWSDIRREVREHLASS